MVRYTLQAFTKPHAGTFLCWSLLTNFYWAYIVYQGVYQSGKSGEPGKFRENELTQGNHEKLRDNDEDSGKTMRFAALSYY